MDVGFGYGFSVLSRQLSRPYIFLLCAEGIYPPRQWSRSTILGYLTEVIDYCYYYLARAYSKEVKKCISAGRSYQRSALEKVESFTIQLRSCTLIPGNS